MKLLTPREAKESFTKKVGDDISQIAYLENTKKSLQNTINTENDQFEKRRKEQQDIYAEEKLKLQEEIKSLILEASYLELARSAQIIPLDEVKKASILSFAKAKLYEKELQKKEEESEEKLTFLTEKINEITDKEEELKGKEKSISIRLEGISKESNQVSEGHKKLNSLISDFNKEAIKRSKELNEKEVSISLREKMIGEAIEIHDRDMANKARALKDRQETLERGFEELRRKQNDTN